MNDDPRATPSTMKLMVKDLDKAEKFRNAAHNNREVNFGGDLGIWIVISYCLHTGKGVAEFHLQATREL